MLQYSRSHLDVIGMAFPGQLYRFLTFCSGDLSGVSSSGVAMRTICLLMLDDASQPSLEASDGDLGRLVLTSDF